MRKTYSKNKYVCILIGLAYPPKKQKTIGTAPHYIYKAQYSQALRLNKNSPWPKLRENDP